MHVGANLPAGADAGRAPTHESFEAERHPAGRGRGLHLRLRARDLGRAGRFLLPRLAARPIIVHTGQRRLYLILGDGEALRFTVGVGKAGRQWSGMSTIDGKFIRPNWAPPAAIRRLRPDLPVIIPAGSPRNPMGAAAMTLSGGEYAIHGTNAPGSVGGFVSFGCIRMLNEDIMDLYKRVEVGTVVLVTR